MSVIRCRRYDEVAQARKLAAMALANSSTAARRLRCRQANKASSTGMQSSAVRAQATNSMLVTNNRIGARQASAAAGRRSRQNVSAGSASAKAHRVNSWLWSM